ncbi:FeoB-associated Cys-rich membrane protein [uncultured Slackia sp.]|uniref:FeoB-associated Cys-rich membrane protein n=1 Tax=uncultured Slackia sp. TaxID=665903 RepID=UPI0025DF25FC|nr:FeoB-associated Cys-rich membrane protein [uncultured Slackia sp.]
MLTMNFATAVVLAIVVALVCLSIRTLRKKGTCGYKKHCGGCSGSCSECPTCSAADSLADEVRRRLAAAR